MALQVDSLTANHSKYDLEAPSAVVIVGSVKSLLEDDQKERTADGKHAH